MSHTDNENLLRECDAGVKMGIDSIEEGSGDIADEKLRRLLADSRKSHQNLKDSIESCLQRRGIEPKDPNMMAKGMSTIKTEFKMMMDKSDATAADLITDGCNMGIKSLHRYLNQYKGADEEVKLLCKKVIETEDFLEKELRIYL